MPLELLPLDFPRVPMEGRTVVVTGANVGVGLYTTANLAKLGATVIMACRNTDKAEAARREVVATVPGSEARLAVRRLDLADLASVRAFADEIKREGTQVDVLINNAGLVPGVTKSTTKDGFELAFQSNHLGAFLLTLLLLPVLERSTMPARVVNVSSDLAFKGEVDLGNLNGERRYMGAGPTYAATKAMNALFTDELARRLAARPASARVRTHALHPGFLRTDLGHNTAPVIGPLYMWWIRTVGGARPAWEGAKASLVAATSVEAGPEGTAAGAWTFYDWTGVPRGKPACVEDRTLVSGLWDTSVRMAGLGDGEKL